MPLWAPAEDVGLWVGDVVRVAEFVGVPCVCVDNAVSLGDVEFFDVVLDVAGGGKSDEVVDVDCVADDCEGQDVDGGADLVGVLDIEELGGVAEVLDVVGGEVVDADFVAECDNEDNGGGLSPDTLGPTTTVVEGPRLIYPGIIPDPVGPTMTVSEGPMLIKAPSEPLMISGEEEGSPPLASRLEFEIGALLA